jgi:hypothetical protein
MNNRLEDLSQNNVFFIFINESNFVTKHNFRLTQQLSSSAITSCIFDHNLLKKYLAGQIDYRPFTLDESNKNLQNNPHWDLKTVNPFLIYSIKNNYLQELDFENYRSTSFPTYPSRMSSIFAFKDEISCLKASQNYKWDIKTVHKFKIIPNPLTRIIKCNMEIISTANRFYSQINDKIKQILWENYWEGHGNLKFKINDQQIETGEIFEYLIEGTVKLV